MQTSDDRTESEQASHTNLVVGRDKFLSGWGKATGGTSYAAWACTDDDLVKVEDWVCGRGDMLNVRTQDSNYEPTGPGHFHVYVVGQDHPALRD